MPHRARVTVGSVYMKPDKYHTCRGYCFVISFYSSFLCRRRRCLLFCFVICLLCVIYVLWVTVVVFCTMMREKGRKWVRFWREVFSFFTYSYWLCSRYDIHIIPIIGPRIKHVSTAFRSLRLSWSSSRISCVAAAHSWEQLPSPPPPHGTLP